MEAEPAKAMASSSSSGPLVGAPDAKDDDLRAAKAAFERNMREYTEKMTKLIPQRSRPKRWFPRLRRLWLLFLVRVHPSSIRFRPSEPLDLEDLDILQLRGLPSIRQQLAMDRQLIQDCLDHYNRLHPGNEYEPVFGSAGRYPHFHNGICWTRGNFIARKKRFGPLSFLLAPRAVFFYELAYIHDSNEVVTCTTVEEPAYYTALGFPLWFATLGSAKLDTFCKTCNRRFRIPRHGTKKIFECGHNDVGNVCEMCSRRSYTWHPDPGEFAFGYRHPYQPYPTKH